ncbi:hypothetical protein EON62_00555, partial [archaeon]
MAACLLPAAALRMEVVAGTPSENSMLPSQYDAVRYPSAARFALLPNGSAAADTVWIADTMHHRVCSLTLTPSGAAAGGGLRNCVGRQGVRGLQGDDGPAAQGLLNYPNSVAAYRINPSSASTELWIADTDNSRIRYVDANGLLSTYAGGGTTPSTGCGGASTIHDVHFNRPTDIVLTVNAELGVISLWVSDSFLNCIVRMDISTGTVTHVAGSGSPGFSGDGGSALLATLTSPKGIAVLVEPGTGVEHVWIADSGNARIRLVNGTSGNISTVAGAGRDETIAALEQDWQLALLTRLRAPHGVAVWYDPAAQVHHLYLSDAGTNLVRFLNGSSQTLATVMGTGASGFCCEGVVQIKASSLFKPLLLTLVPPSSPAPETDALPSVLVADAMANAVRLLAFQPLTVQTLVTGSAASRQSQSRLQRPVFLEPAGGAPLCNAGASFASLFIADSASHLVLRAWPNGTVDTFAGVHGLFGYNGEGKRRKRTTLNRPSVVRVVCDPPVNVTDVPCAAGAMRAWIADTQNHLVRYVDRADGVYTVAGDGVRDASTNGSLAIATHLAYPAAMDVTLEEGSDAVTLWIATQRKNTGIVRVDGVTGVLTHVVGFAASYLSLLSPLSTLGESTMQRICGMSALRHPASRTLRLYASDCARQVVYEIDPVTRNASLLVGRYGPGWSGDGGAALEARVSIPMHMSASVDAATNISYLYIADSCNNRIRRVNLSDHVITTVAGNGLSLRRGWNGSHAHETVAHPLHVPLTRPLHVLVLPGESAASPRMWIADSSASRIVFVNATGETRAMQVDVPTPAPVATSLSLYKPKALAVSVCSAPTREFDLWVVDTGNHRICRITPDGELTTVAGVPRYRGYNGDAQPATAAYLYLPLDVAVTCNAGQQDVWIADTSNNRIRHVDVNGNIATVAGGSASGTEDVGSLAIDTIVDAPVYIAAQQNGSGVTVWYVDSASSRLRVFEVGGTVRSLSPVFASLVPDHSLSFSSIAARMPPPHDPASLQVWYTDLTHNHVRKYTSNIALETVAGGGTEYPTTSLPLASDAQLSGPAAVQPVLHATLANEYDLWFTNGPSTSLLVAAATGGITVVQTVRDFSYFPRLNVTTLVRQFSGLAVLPDSCIAWVCDAKNHLVHSLYLDAACRAAA